MSTVTDDLFSAPMLHKAKGTDGDTDSEKQRKGTDKPHPATYKATNVLRSKAHEVLKREQEQFVRGELPLQQARVWIEFYETSDPLNPEEPPEAYRSTAPERHVQDEPPPEAELNEPDGTKADRAARRVRKEIEGMTPLRTLEHVAHVQQHRGWTESEWVSVDVGSQDVHKGPLPVAEVARIQRDVLRDFRSEARRYDTANGRLDFLDEMLWELNLMDDYGNIIAHVKRKLERVRERVEKQAETTDGNEASFADEPESAVVEGPAPMISTPDRWKHFAGAALVLERKPDISTRKEFVEAADEMGDVGKGATIWQAVQGRLLRDVLHLGDHETTPPKYTGMEGFRRIVRDFLAGNVSKDAET